jgi:hypothetical protein
LRRWLPVLAVLIGVATVARLYTLHEVSADEPKWFSNRVWAERSPQNERDRVLYFVPLEVGSKRSGVIQRSSRYAFGGQVFRWSRDKSRLTLEFPQDQQKAQLTVKTWVCANEAPKGFDLCLELSDGKAKQRFYSRKTWRVPKGEDLPVSVGELPDLGAEGCVDCAELGLDSLIQE